jgi:hypothetical protein
MKIFKGHFFVLAVAFVIIFFQCSPPEKSAYRYPLVKGPAAFYKAAPADNGRLFGADSGRWEPLPMKTGDVWVSMGDNQGFSIRVDGNLPDSMEFTIQDSLVYLNNSLYAMLISDDMDLAPWFRQMRQEEIESLQSIYVSGSIPERYLPWLQSIAQQNPDIDFFLGSDSLAITGEQVSWIAAQFKPTFLAIEIDAPDLPRLSAFSTLESLYLMPANDTTYKAESRLPAMPSLRTLTLAVENDSGFLGKHFLEQNPQLETLSVWGDADVVLKPGEIPRSLKALYLGGNDSLQWLPPADSFPQLRILSINRHLSQTLPLRSLLDFQHLVELGLPASMPQEDFNQLIEANRHLKALSIFTDDTLMVRDYAALRRMKDLRHLVISGQYGSPEPLKQLKRLEYLSLPDEFFKDSAQLASLRQALPGTRIAPNSGFCMGTGWILILWPLTLIFLLFWNRILPAKPVS